ncbi:MAG: aminomethyl-transferring glycine dehydrogenase subunit GcvPB [Opitutales bacterium]
MSQPSLGYQPADFPRETARHYISATDADIADMLKAVGSKDLADLYRDLDPAIRFQEPPAVDEERSYDAVAARMAELAGNNRTARSFLGDGLPDFAVDPIVEKVAGIRNLTTAYTPYQPERSQGTLVTHWIYQCLLSKLTGFEAINSSLYDRSTALFEAICTAIRLARKADTVIVSEGFYPGDLEVIRTLAADTQIQLKFVPLDPQTGLLNPKQVREVAAETGDKLAAIAFTQVNCLGLLSEVDALTDLAAELGVRSIVSVDPMLLATGGLKPPSAFGTHGADILIGEAQHLAIAPNFGGPGLGLFGVRQNETHRNDVRATPGRYVGKAKDAAGRNCFAMVLSTREQHIRKEKATSNICSNQAFLATIAGAALLARGESGLAASVRTAFENAAKAAAELAQLPGLKLAFPEAAFFNELVLEIPAAPAELIEQARVQGLHVGVDVSARLHGSARRLLKISFSDKQGPEDLQRLIAFFQGVSANAGAPGSDASPLQIKPRSDLLRAEPLGLPEFGRAEVERYYQRLGELNVSPDDSCYPLGSCTMKYNPRINDWAANLPGFTDLHPQAPIADAQGALEVLYEIQEWFKAITGLPGVTTQPVAGAQGELVGIKLFQAYHRDRGDTGRDVIFIPRSAHGTNFATAVMAGFANAGKDTGIIYLESGPDGRIDRADFDAKLAKFGERLAGVMITNPNTAGIFEKEFRAIADKVHEAGGLVYMDGANMNAIAGWVNLDSLGVDAVHNNLHKTWTIPHGGGGPGDAIVAVSHRLVDYLPGCQIVQDADGFRPVRAPKSIGAFHRHWGNFAHKVRALTYLYRLGSEGIQRMSAVAVLSSRYLFEKLRQHYPSLPAGADTTPRMHEFILTLEPADFERLEAAGVAKASAIPSVGKLFLDFGYHAPTVAFPEIFGLMIEPTESYTRSELDHFAAGVATLLQVIRETPEALRDAPHFTPVDRIDEVGANRNLQLFESLEALPGLHENRVAPSELRQTPHARIAERLAELAQAQQTIEAAS